MSHSAALPSAPETGHRSARWLVTVGVVWAIAILVLAALSEPTPESLTYLVSILGSGLYTGLLYLTRRWWANRVRPRGWMSLSLCSGSFRVQSIWLPCCWRCRRLG
ncbi:MAG: hypothetical protein HZC41_21565 [Chloroflexi bacterium]|nr:hypothetical protein [Chloroflexota bacterium]